jgi:hypothetical protein
VPDDAPSGTATALLVIHGIGEQNPYETLDQVARGFARYFRGRNATPVLLPERIRHADWTEVAVHLDFPAHERERLSLFEFYWAPYTEGKATYRGVIGWLLRTVLSPLRYLADNLLALRDSRRHNSAGQIVWLMLREVGRATFVYVPFLVIVGILAVLLAQGLTPVRETSRALATAAGQEQHLAALAGAAVCFVIAVMLALFVVQELWQWWRRPTPSVERAAEVAWVILAAAFIVAFWVAALWIARWGGIDLSRYAAIVLRPSHLWLGVFVVLVLWLRRVLVDYVGDIAVYVTADAKSTNFEARAAILKASSEALARLLRGYDRVIVMGHSLGSVIAYDTINELLARAWASSESTAAPAAPPVSIPDLAKLKGLVTFGSPLDKVYYFFRQHVPADQAVRAQILSFLYSFRRGYSGRTYGDFKFTYSEAPDQVAGHEANAFPDLPSFRWLNVWSWMDPVSGPLSFYRLDPPDRLRRWYWIWGIAHLAYWNDPKLYEATAERFL